MAEPEVAATEPIEVELCPGKKYFFCTCGRSKKQPFCDGSHSGTEFTPQMFEVKEQGKCWLCQCKRSANAPYCDGSHEKVAGK